MGKEYNKKNLVVKGKKFEEISVENMQKVQGSGATDSKNISEHTFAAKILMKGGKFSGQ